MSGLDPNTLDRLSNLMLIEEAQEKLYAEADKAEKGSPVSAENIRQATEVLASLNRERNGG